MIQNKQLFERMAAEWIKELMYEQCTFKTIDVLKHMPLKHLGIDFNEIQLNDPQRNEVFALVESLIPIYADQFGYAQKSNGEWAQSNKKPQPWFDGTKTECDPDGVELELCDPFNNYVKKMTALLGADPEVTVVADQQNNAINICVTGCQKPDAYRIFFPGKIQIKGVKGETALLVNGHKKTYKTIADIPVLRSVFHNHPLVDSIKITKTPNGKPNRIFVLFKNRTVQYVNDNFGSLWNATTTTAEALAKEVCDGSGMVLWFSTVSDFDMAENAGEVID